MEIPIPFNVMLIVAFMLTELVILPFYELFKDSAINSYARARLVSGKPVFLLQERKLAEVFGISSGIAINTPRLVLAKGIKIITKLVILSSIAFWESGFNPTTRYATESITFAQQLNSSTNSFYISPFPNAPTREQDIKNLTVFSVEGATTDSNYRMERNNDILSTYLTECIDVDLKRKVNTMYLAVASGLSNNFVVCLNGRFNRESEIAAIYRSNRKSIQTRKVSRVKLIKKVATDRTSSVYKAEVITTSGKGEQKWSGYIAFTLHSHFNSNVDYSMYGFVVGEISTEIHRVNIPLTAINSPIGKYGRCALCDCKYLGEWKIEPKRFTCPRNMTGLQFPASVTSGAFMIEDARFLESAGFHLLPNHTSKFDVQQLVLSLVAQTPYSLFHAPFDMVSDLQNRMLSGIYMYSNMNEKSRNLNIGNTFEVSELGTKRTIICLSLVMIFVLILISFAIRDRLLTKSTGLKGSVRDRTALLWHLINSAHVSAEDRNKIWIELNACHDEELPLSSVSGYSYPEEDGGYSPVLRIGAKPAFVRR